MIYMPIPLLRRSLTLALTVCFFLANGQHEWPSDQLKDATAQPENFSADRLKRIDANMQSWVAEGRMNGGVALIVHRGKVVYQKGFGYDDPEKKIPIRPDHIYRIASQTKAITSVAVLALVGMIFTFAQLLNYSAASYGTALIPVALSTAIMGLEVFVAFLQAFIFMMLTIVYFAMAHEHH